MILKVLNKFVLFYCSNYYNWILRDSKHLVILYQYVVYRLPAITSTPSPFVSVLAT